MKRASLLLAVATLLVTSSVSADNSITVRVGKKTSVDVGLAQGLNCDDLSIAQVEIRNRTPEQNELVILGLKPGRTKCRVGSPPSPNALVKITVLAVED